MSSPKKQPPPPRELNFAVKLVVYGKSFEAANSHSFLVDDVPAGTSTPIGELAMDIRKMTLKQLRPIIEYDRSAFLYCSTPVVGERHTPCEHGLRPCGGVCDLAQH
jgi:hypothetical protein